MPPESKRRVTACVCVWCLAKMNTACFHFAGIFCAQIPRAQKPMRVSTVRRCPCLSPRASAASHCAVRTHGVVTCSSLLFTFFGVGQNNKAANKLSRRAYSSSTSRCARCAFMYWVACRRQREPSTPRFALCMATRPTSQASCGTSLTQPGSSCSRQSSKLQGRATLPRVWNSRRITRFRWRTLSLKSANLNPFVFELPLPANAAAN